MEKHLHRTIKEVMTEFPEVGQILERYQVGCAGCGVGSCLLKDIVEIHNLPGDQEQALMAEIAALIYPGQKIEIPRSSKKVQTKELKYSPPMKKLVDEHGLIKRWIALIPQVLEGLKGDLNGEIETLRGAFALSGPMPTGSTMQKKRRSSSDILTKTSTF